MHFEPGVSKEVVTGDSDQYISTSSYVERQNLSLRIGQRRFTRLNGFSKKFDEHVVASRSTYAHYNFCRVHEALKMTPAKTLGVVDRDAALATQSITTAPDRRCKFTVVEGGRN